MKMQAIEVRTKRAQRTTSFDDGGGGGGGDFYIIHKYQNVV